MCTNQRYIINPYTRKGLYVKCGKCPACLTEKAIHRVRRIKDTYSDLYDCLMVTLTYSRNTCPYFLRSEGFDFSRGRLSALPVYRDSSYRRIRVGSGYDFEYRKVSDESVLLERVPFVRECDFSRLKDLKHEDGKIGVCLYSDLQAFVARLRLNLKRNFNYYESFKTFSCSEYGSCSKRPHFHILLFCRKGDTEIMRSAIVESWPYSDLSFFSRAIEKCYRGASYVASYVNCGSRFPPFLKEYFVPKHSYSKGFGLSNPQFSLSNLISLFDKGDLRYPYVRDDKVSSKISYRLIPKYVIHRYFPKFKGYSRIAPSSQFDVMARLGKGSFDDVRSLIKPLYLSDDECIKINTRLHNAWRRCHDELPFVFGTFDLYYDFHIKIWNLYNSCVLRQHLTDYSVPLNQRYDNLDDVIRKCRSDGSLFPVGFSDDDFLITDPNKFSVNVMRTERLMDSYYDHEKHRGVTNYVLSSLYEEF